MALRPQKLSVTRIEALRRDPYAIYAERILRLTPLEPLAAVMGMREYGTDFHALISQVTRAVETAGQVPDAAAMEALAREAFAEALRDPQFRAFQWPRILNWCRAFLAWDAEQRLRPGQVFVEESGSLPIPLHDGSVFTLTATADRIEIDAEGRATIVDFKTGAAPSIREVKVGFAPQLTLEAEMVARGAFKALPAVQGVTAALYVKFGAEEVVRRIDLDWKGDPPFADVVAEHRNELVRLLNSFRSEATGYVARPFPKYASRFGTYDHLARVKEWSATGGMGEGGGAVSASAPAIPADTIDRQRRASHPDTSAWVSANAGSGKTHVLAQRVLRLLLSGVAPSRILCLTFTKAAAANMSIRVFRRPRPLDTPRRRGTPRRHRRDRRARARSVRRRHGARRGPPALRPHGGDAGRPQDPDHPRFLRAAAPSFPLRGQCAGAVRGARRPPRRRSAAAGPRSRSGGGPAGARDDAGPRRSPSSPGRSRP